MIKFKTYLQTYICLSLIHLKAMQLGSLKQMQSYCILYKATQLMF